MDWRAEVAGIIFVLGALATYGTWNAVEKHLSAINNRAPGRRMGDRLAWLRIALPGAVAGLFIAAYALIAR